MPSFTFPVPYIHIKHALLCCTTHTSPLLESCHSASDACPQSSLRGDKSWQPHISHPGTMRQAGEQLYYSSGMAGSAEGEALTPILMRLYAAQWPSVCRRIRQKQLHSYQRAHCLVEALLSPPFKKKKKVIRCLLFPSQSSQLLQHFDQSAIHYAFPTTQSQQQPHINLVTTGATPTVGHLVQEYPAGRALTVCWSIRLQIIEIKCN